jgi:hypothetical protein
MFKPPVSPVPVRAEDAGIRRRGGPASGTVEVTRAKESGVTFEINLLDGVTFQVNPVKDLSP